MRHGTGGDLLLTRIAHVLVIAGWAAGTGLLLACSHTRTSALPAAPTPPPAPPAPFLASELHPSSDPTFDLSGTWKLKADWQENGQLLGWEKPEFDDSTWREVSVPGPWEEQGVNAYNPRWKGSQPEDSYNGYAWYRRHFQVPADWGAARATLSIGAIDDMDWVYVNGKLVGSTTGDKTYDTPRDYELPAGLLKPGQDNAIAVRVLDQGGVGGIVKGPIELSRFEPRPVVSEEAEEPGRYRETRSQMVQVLGSVVVPADMKVEGDAVAVGGSVEVRGYVTGSAVAVGGSVRVRPGGKVGGDAVSVGGVVESEGGSVEGQVVQVSFLPWAGVGRWGHNPFSGVFGWWPAFLRPFGWLSDLLSRIMLWGILGLALALLFPRRLQVMARALPLYPGWVAVHGVVGAIMTPAVISLLVMAAVLAVLVLVVTVIGIALIPAVALALGCLLIGFLGLVLFGLGGIWLGVGKAASGQLAHPEGAQSVIGPTLLGVIITAVLSVVPMFGVLVVITMLIFAYGVALMTGVGASPEWSHRRLRIRSQPEAVPVTIPPPPPPPSC